MTQVSRSGHVISLLYAELVQPTDFKVHTYQPPSTYIKWNLSILQILFMTIM